MDGCELECIRPRDYVPREKPVRMIPRRKKSFFGRAAAVFISAALLAVSPRLPDFSGELKDTVIPSVTEIISEGSDGFAETQSGGYPANPPAGQPSVTGLEPNASAGGDIKAITIAPASSAGYDFAEGVYVKNGTGQPTDVAAFLKKALPFSESPRVLIIHTHACESFTPGKYDGFEASADDRTSDTRYNVVRVGDEIASALSQAGINVIHDRTLYDDPEYSGAYSRSLAAVKEYLTQYPDIEIVLDIHRDALNETGKSKYKLISDGLAQIMLVVGTDCGGGYHPDWEKNYTFALRLQQALDSASPGIVRPVKLTRSSYNQFTAPGALIVEIGANGNTLSEAVESGRLLAECLAEILY